AGGEPQRAVRCGDNSAQSTVSSDKQRCRIGQRAVGADAPLRRRNVGEPGTARPRTAPRRAVHRDQEGTRTTAGEPAPRLRRTGPHPQHVRHLVPRLVTEQAPDAILTLHRVAEQEARTLLSRRRSAGWRWRWRWWWRWWWRWRSEERQGKRRQPRNLHHRHALRRWRWDVRRALDRTWRRCRRNPVAGVDRDDRPWEGLTARRGPHDGAITG